MAAFNDGIKLNGWGAWVGKNIFGMGQEFNAYNIGDWFRNNYETNNPYLNSLSNSDLGAMLDQFYIEDPNWNGEIIGNRYILDYDSINKYLSQLQDYDKILGEMPTAPDYEAIQKEAYNAINSENQELLGMLEQDLARQ